MSAPRYGGGFPFPTIWDGWSQPSYSTVPRNLAIARTVSARWHVSEFHHGHTNEENYRLHTPIVHNCRCDTFLQRQTETQKCLLTLHAKEHLAHKTGRLARYGSLMKQDRLTNLHKESQQRTLPATATTVFCALCTRPNGQQQRQLKPTLFHQINRL